MPAERPSLGDIQRRIPALPAAQTGQGTQRDVNDAGRGGGSSNAATTRRGPDGSAASDLRQRVPDASGPKVGSALAAEGTRGLGDRGKSSDLGRRTSDGAGPKTAGTVATRKSGSGDLLKRDLGTKPGGIKMPADRPNVSDLRKRIPDLPDGKLKAADGKGKPSGGVSKLPSGGQLDAASVPDLGKKFGGTRTPDGLRSGTQPGMRIVTPGAVAAGKGKLGKETLGPARFSDRVSKGEFDALARGATGQKLKLADQYRLAQQGDVARRMALHRPGNSVVNVANVANVTNVTNVTRVTNVVGAHGFHPHPAFHHRGWISPIFHSHCFLFRSWFGPSWYPGTWWYPRWAPWLHWSWYHRCDPFWDPRPYWCRPVVYPVVVQPWVTWNVPVWNPLPEVPAGTWVDVQRPVIAEEQYDLQVLAVRFVDPGHPDEKLGPRYRVWFRNNSNKAITQPFDVRLFATPGEQLDGNAPQAAVRVTAIEAGETQSVDVRLPFQPADAVPGAAGKPPFAYLHAIADANREIRDVNEANNGARVTFADVLPVDPAAFETDPKTVAGGGELIIAGEGFGPEPGKVIVHLGNIELEAELLGWYDLGVRLRMPDLPLAEATEADLVVIRGDGAAANPVAVTVNPPQR